MKKLLLICGLLTLLALPACANPPFVPTLTHAVTVNTNGALVGGDTNLFKNNMRPLTNALNDAGYAPANVNLSGSFSGIFAGNGAGLTNLNYGSLANAPVIPATNGFVTASITNGLAATTALTAETTRATAAEAGLTNTITAETNRAQNAEATLVKTNDARGLLLTNAANTFAGNFTNGIFTGNGAGLTNLNYGSLANAPVIPATNGFVTAAITNGLANVVTTATANMVTNGANNTIFFNRGLSVAGDIVEPDNGIFSTTGTFQGGNFAGDGSTLTNLNYANIANPPVIPANTGSVNLEDSRFGGRGDGVTLYDAVTTNGSPLVTSASAAFTATDIGKWAVVYTDAYNTNYVLAKITNIVSANSVLLNSNVLSSAVGMTMNYFSDNAAAIKAANNYCLSNGVGTILFTNQSNFYGVVGAFQSNATYQSSIITVPAQPVNPQYRSITFRGARPMRQAETGYSVAPASRIGSIIYCPAKPNSTNNCLFGLSASDGQLFSSFNYHFENLMLLAPCNPKLTMIQNWNGGGLEVKECNITVDYSAGKVNQTLGERYAYGIITAQNNNSADQLIEDSEITQYGVGVEGQEHLLLKNTVIANCRVGLESAFGTGVNGSMAELINNYTNVVKYGSGQVNFQGAWYFENCFSYADFATLPAGSPIGGQMFVIEGCAPLKFQFGTNAPQNLTNTYPARFYGFQLNIIGSQSGFLSQKSSFLNGAAFSSGDAASDGDADLKDPFYIGGGQNYNNSGNHGLFHIQGFGGQDIWRMAGQINWLSGNTQVASLDSSGNFTVGGVFTGNGSGLTNLSWLNLTNPPVIPSTNGFVTASVTNGLATSAALTILSNAVIAYANAQDAGALAATNGTVYSSLRLGTNFYLTNATAAGEWDLYSPAAAGAAVQVFTNKNVYLNGNVTVVGTLTGNGGSLTNLPAATISWTNLLTTNWTIGAGWTNLADGSYLSTNASGYNAISQYVPAANLIDGGVYWLKYYVATNTSGSLQNFFDLNNGPTAVSVGGEFTAKKWACYSFIWNANAPASSSTNQIVIRCANGWVGAIRNIGLYGPK